MVIVMVFAVTFAVAISLADDVEKRLFEGKCSECHRLDLPLVVRHDKKGWREIVERMKTYGATIDGKEAEIIVEYLSKEKGRK